MFPTAGHSCLSPPQTLSTAHCRVCTKRDRDDTAPCFTLTMARLSEHPVLTHPLAHTTLQGCVSFGSCCKNRFPVGYDKFSPYCRHSELYKHTEMIKYLTQPYTLMSPGHRDPDGTTAYAGQMWPDSSWQGLPLSNADRSWSVTSALELGCTSQSFFISVDLPDSSCS